jgi:hypothetical protein
MSAIITAFQRLSLNCNLNPPMVLKRKGKKCAAGSTKEMTQEKETYHSRNARRQEETNFYLTGTRDEVTAELIYEHGKTGTRTYRVMIPNEVEDGAQFFVKAGTSRLQVICPDYEMYPMERCKMSRTLMFDAIPCSCQDCLQKKMQYPALSCLRLIDSMHLERMEHIIKRAQGNDPMMTKISISRGWTCFASYSYERLYEALRTNKLIHTISLKNVPFGDKIIDYLIKALVHWDYEIRTVRIKNACLTRDSLDALVEAMSHNSSVKELCLSNVGLDEEAAQLIAIMISANSALIELELSHNPMGNEGGTYFAQTLHCHDHLRVMNLLHTSIGEECILRTNDSMQKNGL